MKEIVYILVLIMAIKLCVSNLKNCTSEQVNFTDHKSQNKTLK